VRDDWQQAMSSADFEQFNRLVDTDSRSDLARQFSHMMVAGSDARKTDLKQLSPIYSEHTLPDFQVMRSGLELLRRLDLRGALVKLRAPSLFLFGANDVLVPSAVSEDIRHVAPTAIVQVIKGMGHLPCLSYQSDIKLQLERLLTSGTGKQ